MRLLCLGSAFCKLPCPCLLCHCLACPALPALGLPAGGLEPDCPLACILQPARAAAAAPRAHPARAPRAQVHSRSVARCCCCGGWRCCSGPAAGARLVPHGGQATPVAHYEGGVVGGGVAERLPGAVEDGVGAAVVGDADRETAVIGRVSLKIFLNTKTRCM